MNRPENAAKAIMAIAIIVLIVVLAGCSAIPTTGGGPIIRGEGPIVTEEFTGLDDFTGFSLSVPADVTITVGDDPQLTLSGQDNLVRRTEVVVEDGTLFVRSNENNVTLLPTEPMEINLVVESLSVIDLSGAGRVTSDGLSAEDFTLVVSGVGAVNFDNFEATTLNVDYSGSGTLDLDGTVGDFGVTLSGLGTVGAGDLQAESVTVTVSGAGTATVWATDLLTVDISGAGNVEYYGSPELTEEVSGVGEISSLGEK